MAGKRIIQLDAASGTDLDLSSVLAGAKSDSPNSKKFSIQQVMDLIGFKVAKVTVTSAQLKDLVANPVTIVAAPGVGKITWPISVFLDYKFGTVAYVNPGGVAIEISHSPNAELGYAVFNLENQLLVASASKYWPAPFSDPGVGNVLRTVGEDAPLYLNNYSGENLTTGDGTLTISVVYRIVDLS